METMYVGVGMCCARAFAFWYALRPRYHQSARTQALPRTSGGTMSILLLADRDDISPAPPRPTPLAPPLPALAPVTPERCSSRAHSVSSTETAVRPVVGLRQRAKRRRASGDERRSPRQPRICTQERHGEEGDRGRVKLYTPLVVFFFLAESRVGEGRGQKHKSRDRSRRNRTTTLLSTRDALHPSYHSSLSFPSQFLQGPVAAAPGHSARRRTQHTYSQPPSVCHVSFNRSSDLA